MRLADLVATSRRVTETRSRLEKISALGDLLRRLGAEEIDIAVAFLSGHLRQGRIGLGGAAVRNAMPGSAAAEPSLTLGEVDAALGRIAATDRRGLHGRTGAPPRARSSPAPPRDEQDFLVAPDLSASCARARSPG